VRILSAVDAISPAWEHTRRLLFARRDWRLLLKIGAVAVFAEAGGCNSSFNFPSHHVNNPFPAVMAVIVAFALLLSIVGLVICLAFFYLGSRLQFTLFDIVLRSDTVVAPIWRRYGGITWRWMGLKFLFFLAALVCVLPLLIPVILRFIHTVGANGTQIADPAGFIVTLFGFIASIFLIVILISACYILLRDFGLPSMAMENTSLGLTVGRIFRLIRVEPGQVALYLLMHFLMRIAGAFVGYFVLGFATLIALIPLGGAALGLWFGLHNAGTSGRIAMIAGWVTLAIILLVLLAIASIMLFGYLFTFFQAYALYFLGGRYPMIGAYLDSAMPPIVPPVMPPPGYGYAGQPPVYPPPAYVPPEPIDPAPPPADPEPHA
jgi:hypothetical protein